LKDDSEYYHAENRSWLEHQRDVQPMIGFHCREPELPNEPDFRLAHNDPPPAIVRLAIAAANDRNAGPLAQDAAFA
jgi:hypothetical protein